MILKFDSGALASLNASFEAATPVEATITGSEGMIRMTNRFHDATGNVELTQDLQPLMSGEYIGGGTWISI